MRESGFTLGIFPMRRPAHRAHACAMETTTRAADSAPGAPSDAGPSYGGPSYGGPRALRRVYHGRMLGGVAAGLADHLALDVTVVRVAFAVLAVTGGLGIAAYLACLLLIPEEGTDQSIAGSMIDSLQSR